MGNAVIVAIFPDPTSIEDLGRIIEVAQRNFKGVNPDVKLVLMNETAANTVEYFATNQELPVSPDDIGGVKDDVLPDLGLGGTYRKKSIKVRAERLCWRNWSQICELFEEHGGRLEHDPAYYITQAEVSDTCGEPGPDYMAVNVTTVHGDPAVVRHGDWIIPDSEPGTFYPCKPDVFKKTYERVS